MATEKSRFASLRGLREPKNDEEEEASEVFLTVGQRGNPDIFTDNAAFERAMRRGQPRKKGKRSNPSYEQSLVYLRGTGKRKAMVILTEKYDGRDLSDLLNDLLHDWLEEQGVRLTYSDS